MVTKVIAILLVASSVVEDHIHQSLFLRIILLFKQVVHCLILIMDQLFPVITLT